MRSGFDTGVPPTGIPCKALSTFNNEVTFEVALVSGPDAAVRVRQLKLRVDWAGWSDFRAVHAPLTLSEPSASAGSEHREEREPATKAPRRL